MMKYKRHHYRLLGILLMLLLGFQATYAQFGITEAEYFWDNDPGLGNGFPLNASDGNFNQELEQIFTDSASLPSSGGFHVLHIRAKGSNNDWSPAYRSVFRLEIPPRNISLSMGEYFWDTDPGLGNGIPVLAVDGNYDAAIESIFSNPVTSSALSGAHTFNIRVLDVNGNWGKAFARTIYIQPGANFDKIQQAEYFWDTDPGPGNGTPLLALDGTFNEEVEAVFADINLTNFSSGFHTFNIRIRGRYGWGPVFQSIFELTSGARFPQVSAAEYFWDTDPGQGNGIPLLAFDGDFDDAFETVFENPINTPNAGRHTFHVRAMDNSGNWSPTFSQAVTIQSGIRMPRVTSAEYFWDSDPGQGNGMPLLVIDGNFDNAFETVFQNIQLGFSLIGRHVFSVRARDNSNLWGPVFATAVTILPQGGRTIQVNAAEYFWDSDPGQGNGTPIFAFDGNFDEALETIFSDSIIATPSNGFHTFSIRVQDAENNWGPVHTQVIRLESAPRNFNLTMAEYFWNTDPGEGNATPILAEDGAFDEVLETALDSMLMTLDSVGHQAFYLRVMDANGNWGRPFGRTIYLVPRKKDLNITFAEYFWDTDPGEGNATPIQARDGNFDAVIEAILGDPVNMPFNTGTHTFNLRARDAENNWGPVYRSVYFIENSGPTLEAKVFLQGPFDTNTGLMWDSLRINGLIPLNEPYTAQGFPNLGNGGGEQIQDSLMVFGVSGPNAIVDWILVFAFSDTVTPVASRRALLQRDGDIVATDGISPLEFDELTPGYYYIGVRHRNHLSIFSQDSILLDSSSVITDFRDGSAVTYGQYAQVEVDTVNQWYACWAGDGEGSSEIFLFGPSNDLDFAINSVLNAPLNFMNPSLVYEYPGYHFGDYNLDGKVVISGKENDLFLLLKNVVTHPANINFNTTYIIQQQSP